VDAVAVERVHARWPGICFERPLGRHYEQALETLGLDDLVVESRVCVSSVRRAAATASERPVDARVRST
jgi:hypothetical protein